MNLTNRVRKVNINKQSLIFYRLKTINALKIDKVYIMPQASQHQIVITKLKRSLKRSLKSY